MKHSIIPVLSRILVQLIAFSVLPVPAEETLTELVKKIRPSVVLISTYDSDGEPLGRGSGFFANKK
ncbi:MAG TPA: hypothetical protein PLG59_11175, partial [bacterium]|nr:hypothetical protein [bacterium]